MWSSLLFSSISKSPKATSTWRCVPVSLSGSRSSKCTSSTSNTMCSVRCVFWLFLFSLQNHEKCRWLCKMGLRLCLSQSPQNWTVHRVCAVLALLWRERSKGKEDVFMSFLSLSVSSISKTPRLIFEIQMSQCLSISKSSKLRALSAMSVSGSSVTELTKRPCARSDAFSVFLSHLSQKD